MSPPIDAITGQARALAAAGDLTAARDLLSPALDAALSPGIPPPQPYTEGTDAAGSAPAGADAGPTGARRIPPEVADAAALQAGILMTLGDPHAARPWAGLAHQARLHLYGPADLRTVTAEATLAAVLHRTGAHRDAAARYTDVVDRLTALDGPDSARVLAAEADLATAEHAGGDCPAALARLTDTVHRHRTAFGDDSPAGIKMLARLGAMARDCGDTATGDHHLATAADLCRRHLPADHPLTRQVAELATAAADPAHPDRHTGPPPPPVPEPAVPTGSPAARTAPDTFGPGTDPAADQAHPARPAAVSDLDGDAPVGAAGQEAGPSGAGTGAPPPGGDRRLPVPLLRGEPSRRWMATTAVLVALAAVALLALAAAGVYRMLSPGTTAAPAPTPAAPATTAPAGPDGAPSGVSLRDSRDSVALTWTYPAGSEGPVIVSGGRSGQPTKAFQQLPAGSESYVVYGLNDQLDYCFSVAVAWSADRVPASAPVCTSRTVPNR